jgi:diguanylate cyclase (GGDEF)-like protein
MGKGGAGRPRIKGVVAVFCGCLVALAWAATVQRVSFEREEALQAEMEANANLAMAMEEHTVRTLRAAEQVATFVRHQYRTLGLAASLQSYVERGVIREKAFNIISVVNERGDIVLSSRRTGPVNYRDRDFFAYQERIGAGLFVSRPVLGRVSQTWQIPMSLRMNKPDGSFGGVVVLSVDPGHFTAIYEHARLGRQGVVSLIGHDGIARVRRAGQEIWHGHEVGAGGAFAEGPADGVHIGPDTLDGVRRIFSYRRLQDYPLTVQLGTAEEEALRPARERSRVYYAAAALVSALIAGFGLLLIRYLTKRNELEARLAHQAQHDPLTGLPNRALLHDRLAQQVMQARRRTRVAALLFVDLDRFKAVNDSFGHACGDAVLRATAARLLGCLRGTDTVARYGGDEFAVVAGDLGGVAEAQRIADKILQEVARPIKAEGRELAISASVGIATYPADGLDADTLLRKADMAALSAKQGGRNKSQAYGEALPA